MKIAFLAEGLSDDIVLPILVKRILNCDFDAWIIRRRLADGIDVVKRQLPKTVETCAWRYYDGLVVVVDSDSRPPHLDSHIPAEHKTTQCDYCALIANLPVTGNRPTLPPLKIIIGVAVQALESWLLADGKLPGPPEVFSAKYLKRFLYGTEDPNATHFEKIAKPKAEQINLDVLRMNCPSFKFFEHSVQSLQN